MGEKFFLFVAAIISIVFTKQYGNRQLEAEPRGTLERLLIYSHEILFFYAASHLLGAESLFHEW